MVAMKKEDISEFGADLEQHCMKEFNYKRSYCWVSPLVGTLMYAPSKVDLYIRWQPNSIVWKDDTLVIARIYLREVRVGHGTRLLNFIVNLADKYHYKKIVIECANDNSSGFARHHGFQMVEKGKSKDWWITTHWVLYLD